MSTGGWLFAIAACVSVLGLGACGRDQPVDADRILSQPKAFVTSETCKQCHLEHYDSWKMTLHSRPMQDAKEIHDAFIVKIEEKKIRKDLERRGGLLKVPADRIYIPAHEEILYTIGGQWKQLFLVKREGTLLIAPIQYFADTGRWANYHEEDWDKRSWFRECSGCHATGVNVEKQTWSEPAVGCEACHGKGSWHSALPKTAVFKKRQTIINPAKLRLGVAVQICGSCHSRGKSTVLEGCEWPVGYEPGLALQSFFQITSFAGGDVKNVYANEFSKGHHQQYLDWSHSQHAREGVTCTSCHYVHQIGIPPTRSQTRAAGSKQCFDCHQMVNNNLAHSIHSFGNCVGCHMPRIVTSAESRDMHSHVFVCLLPKDTLTNRQLPCSCETCHKHAEADFEELQKKFDALAILPKPVGLPVRKPAGPDVK
ncbi:MAG: multiheme c-type cytochrome [Thermodesulfobacteriota bacterium]